VKVFETCTVTSKAGIAEGPTARLTEMPRNRNGGGENSKSPPIDPAMNLTSQPMPHDTPERSDGVPKISVITGPAPAPTFVHQPPPTEANTPSSGVVDP